MAKSSINKVIEIDMDTERVENPIQIRYPINLKGRRPVEEGLNLEDDVIILANALVAAVRYFGEAGPYPSHVAMEKVMKILNEGFVDNTYSAQTIDAERKENTDQTNL